jgi:excinuclease UvrABC ATPase subunit
MCRSLQAKHVDAVEEFAGRIPQCFAYGSGTTSIKFTYREANHSYHHNKPFEGVIPNIERRWRNTDSDWMREELTKYQLSKMCDACHGQRLNPKRWPSKSRQEYQRDLRIFDQEQRANGSDSLPKAH